ncbi:hypothetical protein CU044_3739 [Streptomyces sp. L-9-10]|uniref:hypothetical protein n=1 Tax=Streptomyces sp. L-9-10 TaxID=1478131 RepID=UPI00101D20BE|nr:hypothetical protein [Streptomyces sp. L-9-10]RYJ26446.1 hypothetical protein CU044_3739 [Streptomyces sp. L-9-10]
MPEARHTADTITDDALDRLYARITTLEAVAAGNRRHVQTIAPEIDRLTEERDGLVAELARVRRALDGTEPTDREPPGPPS